MWFDGTKTMLFIVAEDPVNKYNKVASLIDIIGKFPSPEFVVCLIDPVKCNNTMQIDIVDFLFSNKN